MSTKLTIAFILLVLIAALLIFSHNFTRLYQARTDLQVSSTPFISPHPTTNSKF